MVRLPAFQYHAPASLDEACGLLGQHAGDIKLLAGGTDILPAMKNRLHRHSHLLDLRAIPGLRGIEQQTGSVTIGPLTTLAELQSSPVINAFFPALSQAAGQVGGPQLRFMGTAGGNIALETRCLYYHQPQLWHRSVEPCLKRGGAICHVVKSLDRCYAYCASDTVPVMVALDAQVTLTSTDGSRILPVRDLFSHDGRNPLHLRSTEIITSISLQLPAAGSELKHASRYAKLAVRKALDFPLAGVAVALATSGRVCQRLAVVLGALGSGPIVVEEAARCMTGREITPALIEQAGVLAHRASRPVANAATSPAYRREMAGVLVRRILFEMLEAAIASEEASS